MTRWKQNTAIFIVSQMISLFGSALVQYAITWHITLETKSGVYTTIAIVCGFLPTFFLAPFAGVWADRYHKKKLIILADGAIALTTLALAGAFMLGYEQMWLLFLALGVRGLGGAVQMPCVNAILPSMVPEEHLTRVNGINNSVQAIITLGAPVLSGALMGVARLEWIFFIDVFTAVLAIGILLFFLKLPARAGKGEATKQNESSYFGEMKKGLAYVRSHRYLMFLFLFIGIIYVMIGPVAFMMPLQIVRFFGDEVWRLSASEVAYAVGMIAGGILISVWSGFRNKTVTITVSLFLMGGGVILLGAPSYFWFYLVVVVIIGIMLTIVNTTATVMLQTKVDPAFHGRIFGILSMLSSSLMPMGMLIFGPLSDKVPIEYLFIGTGIGIVVIALAVIATPALRQAGKMEKTQA